MAHQSVGSSTWNGGHTIRQARRGGGKLSAGTGVPGPEEGVIELVNLANAGNLSPGYLPHPKITVAATCPRT